MRYCTDLGTDWNLELQPDFYSECLVTTAGTKGTKGTTYVILDQKTSYLQHLASPGRSINSV